MAGRCDCQKTCNCAVAASDTVAMSGSGSPQQPFTPAVRRALKAGNAVVLVPASDPDGPGVAVFMLVKRPDGTEILVDEDGFVVIPPPVIRPAGGGDPIDPDVDGGITLPSATAPAYGDGLTVVATKLVPQVGPWPGKDLAGNDFPGASTDLDLFGGRLYRTTEGLFGPPEHTAVRANGAGTPEAAQLTAVTTTFASNALAAVSITNPSTQRYMVVERTMVISPTWAIPTDGDVDATMQEKIDGGGFSDVRTTNPPVPSGAAGQTIRSKLDIIKVKGQVIAPGATHSVQVRMSAAKTGSGGNPVFLGMTASIELFGVTV